MSRGLQLLSALTSVVLVAASIWLMLQSQANPVGAFDQLAKYLPAVFGDGIGNVLAP